LIAVEGIGSSLAATARAVTASVRRRQEGSGRSSWNASGLFGHIGPAPNPSPRTMTLLYAADLAFRLRWQIAPALEAGLTVVAVPYVGTATALAVAAGLPRKWVSEVFRFAPEADRTYNAPTRPSGRAGRPSRDYGDWFVAAIESHGGNDEPPIVRKRALAALAALERRGLARRFA
jgi:hypothetical protein